MKIFILVAFSTFFKQKSGNFYVSAYIFQIISQEKGIYMTFTSFLATFGQVHQDIFPMYPDKEVAK